MITSLGNISTSRTRLFFHNYSLCTQLVSLLQQKDGVIKGSVRVSYSAIIMLF